MHVSCIFLLTRYTLRVLLALSLHGMETTVPHHNPATFTETELREHYALTGLARLGISYERATATAGIKTALINSVDAARRTDQRRAMAHPLTHYPEAA